MQIYPFLWNILYAADINNQSLNKGYRFFEILIAWQREFLGGASLEARILFEDLKIDLDPLSSGAPLLFLNEPLSGTAGPSVGRFVVVGCSPATRLLGESKCGGFWGPELRMAGFDSILIKGKAEEPFGILFQENLPKIS